MDRKIVLIGKSCSGKSTFANLLKKKNLKPQLSTTTRPKRDYEVNGIEYNFISNEEFKNLEEKGGFVEVDIFNGWNYGLTYKDFNEADILILTPRGLKKYIERFGRKKFLIIYIEISPSLRKERNEIRGDGYNDMMRRWIADDLDFETMEEWNATWDLKFLIKKSEDFNYFFEKIFLKKTK